MSSSSAILIEKAARSKISILSHRHLQAGARIYRVAMSTFTHDAAIRWDKARNYSHHRGGTGESATALKKALASPH
jgi:hypothetical protein